MDILDMKLEANRVTRSYLMEVFKEIDNERTKAKFAAMRRRSFIN
jgi:hypothetical protein